MMIKFDPMALLLPLLALVMAGCFVASCSQQPAHAASTAPEFHELLYYRDPSTGCQYVSGDIAYGRGIIPRLGADGKPMCGGASK